MNFNFKKLHILSIALLPALYFTMSSCGKIEGFANSGTTNKYNFVYVGSYGSSTINSYYLNSTGNLIVAANAISTGGGTTNVNDFAATANGQFLYSVNRASNNVSCYSIDQFTALNPGTLTPTAITAAGGGASSMAIHPNGKFAYVTNSTAVSDNLSFYNVNQTTGVLNSADTTYTTTRLNATAQAFTPNGSNLFIANRGTSDITTYTVNSVNGALILVNASVATGTNPEDIAVHPNGIYVYTLSVGLNRVYGHSIGSGGVLTALSPAFFATGAGPKKLVITPNGKYMYVSNNTDNTFSVFSISAAGIPTPIGTSPVAGVTGAGVYAMAITSDSKFLIASGDTSAKLYVYSIDDATGMITQIGTEISLGGSNPRTIEIVPISVVQ